MVLSVQTNQWKIYSIHRLTPVLSRHKTDILSKSPGLLFYHPVGRQLKLVTFLMRNRVQLFSAF